MMGGKTSDRRHEGSPARVFEAARGAVSAESYSVLHPEMGSWVISLNTGRSMSSWIGQDVSASFFADGTGTKVVRRRQPRATEQSVRRRSGDLLGLDEASQLCPEAG